MLKNPFEETNGVDNQKSILRSEGLDIGNDISAQKQIYVDDTKVKRGIKNNEDVESLQTDLDKLYDWAKTNNMVYNGTKFQAIRYGNKKDIKEDTNYFTEDTGEIIEIFETLRDLGVILSEEANFKAHVLHVEQKVRRKIPHTGDKASLDRCG